MASKENALKNVNRIAETQFMIRPRIIDFLQQDTLTPEGKAMLSANTYYEFWVNNFHDRFYDMGTLIRLGTEIENGLKYYYMEKKGYKTLLELKSGPNYSMGIFQRVMPWTQNNVIELFKKEIGYELDNNPKIKDIQEIMLYRHLYAHSSGLLNNKFITDYGALTDKDVLASLGATAYPSEDVYFFEGLNNLNKYIEETRRFFSNLP